MKQLFHIENNNSDGGQQVLSLSLGQKHGGFAITNKSGIELYQLAVCSTDEPILRHLRTIGWNEKELTEFFAAYPMLNNSFYQVQVVYDFPESILISSKEFKQADAGLLLNSLCGKRVNVQVVSELIADWQLYNIYAVPKETQEWLERRFSTAQYGHQYSLQIKNINNVDDNGTLAIDFRKDDFTLIASKGSHFLLAQTFEYLIPADVIYSLLKTCQQFSLSQQLVQLKLSGLIDIQSNLYKELYQYFFNVGFREATWNGGNQYPAHFFTSLNDLVRCAS